MARAFKDKSADIDFYVKMWYNNVLYSSSEAFQ